MFGISFDVGTTTVVATLIDLTNGAGTTTGSYSYDIFGGMRSETGTGAAANEFRFTGEQRDPQISSQFYYLRARYYEPGEGTVLVAGPAA